jgi:ribonuclease H2 subunit A
MRDRFLESWKFSEPIDDISREFGSGYPSDPKCKAWMAKLQDPIFGYGDVVRFSWAPTKQKFEEDDAVRVIFKADLDEDEDLIQEQKGMSTFLGGKKRKRPGYFDRRKLRVVSSLS